MRIFRSIGFGIFLLILSVAMPRVFRAVEETILAFLTTTQTVLLQAQDLTASPAKIQLLVPSVSYH